MLELSAFLRFTVANLRHCPSDKKKKRTKKELQNMVDIIHHTEKKNKNKNNNWVGNGSYCFDGSCEEKKKKVLGDIGEQNV